MELSRSTFYYKRTKDPLEKQKQDSDLRDKIERIHLEFPKAGYRMILRHLENDGILVGERKIRQIMLKFSLFAEIKRAFVVTTDSNHEHIVYPNLLPEMALDGINQVWTADITYIRIRSSFIYLAVILDLFSRKVVGWAISKTIDQALTLEALRSAIETRKPPAGVIHHSDRGVQYLCDAYVECLKENKFHMSCSRRGNPYDNAWTESFMKTLKREEAYLWKYETMMKVELRLPFFIEEVYNKKCPQSSLGYLSPDAFEEKLTKNQTVHQAILKL